MSIINSAVPYDADFKTLTIQGLFPSRSVTYESSGTTSLADIFGVLPDNAGGIDIWSPNTMYCRFDGRAVTSANCKLLPNVVYRLYGTQYILNKFRFAIDADETTDMSESSVSGTIHDMSAILYCTDANMDEWESSGSSGSSSSSSYSNSHSSASSASSKSLSSNSSSSKSSKSYSSESSASYDDVWKQNN